MEEYKFQEDKHHMYLLNIVFLVPSMVPGAQALNKNILWNACR